MRTIRRLPLPIALLLLAPIAGATPALEAETGAGGRVTVRVAGAPAGCTVRIHGHPKRRRAAAGPVLASVPGGDHPRLLHGAVEGAPRTPVHLAAVVACPGTPEASSAPVAIRPWSGPGRRVAGRAWLGRLGRALVAGAAERGGDPGLPARKRAWRDALAGGVQGTDDPEGAFAFDPGRDFVAAAPVHGTEVVVAIAADARPPVTRLELARRAVDLFHHHWHVFGGFPLDRYVVTLRPPAEAGPWAGFVGGLAVPDAEVQHPVFWEFLAHETFHAWNGGALRPEPDGSGNLFQRETWLVEGATVYQAFRALGTVVGPEAFSDGMRYRYDAYAARVGGPVDRSIQQLCDAIGTWAPGTSGDLEVMLYARGMLLAYLLDARLAARGTSLDAVLQRLWAAHGSAGVPWRQADFEAALLAASAPDVVAEHATLLAGAGDLRPLVAGGFTWFAR